MTAPVTYQKRVARIRARIASPHPHAEDVRRDVLWLLAELEESRAALPQDDARRTA
jgi:hypothetical protein